MSSTFAAENARLKTSEDEIGSWAMAGCVDFAHEFSPLDS